VMSFRRPLGLLSCSWATLNLMEFCHEGDLVSNFSVKGGDLGFFVSFGGLSYIGVFKHTIKRSASCMVKDQVVI
jgi:hypothetical protein